MDELIENLKIFQGDWIDEQVYRCDELEIWGAILWKKIYNNTPILNQSLDPITANGCGAFSQCKVLNEMNYIEGTYNLNKANPVNFWKRTVENYWWSYTRWSTLAWNINNAKKSWFISGYYSCQTVADMKTALDNWHIIVTGSARVDWREVFYSNNYVLSFTSSPEYYHLFCIVWYDDDKKLFTIANSRWENRLDNWLCYIRYADIGYLYTRIACIDTKDTQLIDKVVADRELLEKAKEEKIWNGERAGDAVVRYEAVLMACRKIGIYWTDDEILHEAKEKGIWNGSNKYWYAKRYEVALIAGRALKKDSNTLWNGKNADANATRWQTVLMLMR